MVEALALMAAQVAASGGISVGMKRLSPWVAAPVRHLFAGAAPLAFPFAWILGANDSVTLMGPHLAAAGGLLALGIGVSVALGRKYELDDRTIEEALQSR